MININFKENKGFRLLHIYERLVKGECLNKENLASSFNVTTKSIQRDRNKQNSQNDIYSGYSVDFILN